MKPLTKIVLVYLTLGLLLVLLSFSYSNRYVKLSLMGLGVLILIIMVIVSQKWKTYHINLLLMIMLLGATFNILAVVSNDFKMPVYIDTRMNEQIDLENHFVTSDKSEINNFFLVDRFNWANSIMSVGDMVALFAGAGVIISVLVLGFRAAFRLGKFRFRKRRKVFK